MSYIILMKKFKYYNAFIYSQRLLNAEIKKAMDTLNWYNFLLLLMKIKVYGRYTRSIRTEHNGTGI
jgi:hypothetical protein